MATKIGSLFGDVSLRTAKLDKDIAAVGRKMRKMGSGMKAVGRDLTTKLTAPLLGIGAAALVSFGKFEKGMNEVRSLMPDLNQGEFVKMQEEVRELSVTMGIDAVDAVGALYQAISAGVPKDNAITFLATAAKTGIAGLSSTTTAVDTLTSILNAYKRPASDAEDVADALFTTVRLGKTNFEELGASIFNVAPMAAAMNIPLEEITGAVASLTKQGVPTAQAMTQIRGSLVALQKPNADMVVALGALGYSTGQALLDAKGYQGALQSLRTETGLTSSQLTAAFGRVEAFGAVLALTGQNFDGAIEDLRAMTQAGGAMAAAFETNNAGLFRSWEKSLAIIRELGFVIAEDLAPKVEKVVENFRAWYEVNQTLVPQWSSLGVQLAGVAAVVGPLIILLGAVTTALSSVSTWIGLIAVGSFSLSLKLGLVHEAGEALGQLLVDIFVNPNLTGAIGSFIALLAEVVEWFTGPFGLTFNAERMRSDVIAIFRAIGRAVDAVISSLQYLWELFGKVTGATAAGNFLGGLISDIAFRAEGGPVSGGSPYIVGEQGPELFVPRYSGAIVPNHAMGGGSGQTINMTFNGVGMEMKSWLKNNRSALARIAVDAVSENNLRTV
jgi:TP901 family phage tail tape measure protein